ncbi:MAG: hypothetical protein KDC92_14195, partial [Bacteroidetes bacterium]|nr:hypothetical protein [Bacteroidota bacterium]
MKTVGTFILLIIGVSAIAQEEWNMLPGEINAEADQHLIPSKSKIPDQFWHVVKDAANHIIDSIPYTDDDVNGTRKLYKDGKLWQVIPYKFNKIEGEKLYYFPNGAIRAQTDYVNNQRQGKRIIYYEGNKDQKRPKKQYDMSYFWGLLHGPLKVYSQPPQWYLVSRTEY